MHTHRLCWRTIAVASLWFGCGHTTPESTDSSSALAASTPDASSAALDTVAPEIPDEAGLERLATMHARSVWGDVQLVDAQPYFLPDGQINSWMFVFSTDGATPHERAEILSGLHAGTLQAEALCGVEVGARVENPPIMAYWTGLPYEYAVLDGRKMTAVLGEETRIHKRFGSATRPVFETERSGEHAFFHPRSGRVFDANPIRMKPQQPQTASAQQRIRHNRDRWSQTLPTL